MTDDLTFFHFITSSHPEKDPIIALINKNQPGIFASDDYLPLPVACFIKLISMYAVFTWNYLDAFIMVLSVGLSANFKLINDKLERAIHFAPSAGVHPHLSVIHPILKVNRLAIDRDFETIQYFYHVNIDLFV